MKHPLHRPGGQRRRYFSHRAWWPAKGARTAWCPAQRQLVHVESKRVLLPSPRGGSSKWMLRFKIDSTFASVSELPSLQPSLAPEPALGALAQEPLSRRRLLAWVAHRRRAGRGQNAARLVPSHLMEVVFKTAQELLPCLDSLSLPLRSCSWVKLGGAPGL